LDTERHAATGPAVWRSGDLEPAAWRLEPADGWAADWERLVAAASAGNGRPVEAGTSLRELAAAIRAAVQEGPGLALVRGLPVAGAGDAELAAAMLAFATAVGRPEQQTADGDRVFRVEDRGLAFNGQTRAGVTREALGFHTDGRDAAGLLCVRASAEGGVSSVTSAGAIHNAMLERDPELLAELYRPWHFDRRGAPGTPTLVSPVFSRSGDHMSCFYVPHTLRSGPARVGEELTPTQLRALERFDELAADPELRVDMTLAPGDLQIVNNYAVVHARSAFAPATGPETARLLLRVWLTMPERWPLAPGFKYHVPA
jgi:Taurine catabolism dioxygenase TauD, TfdA family